MSEPIVFLFVVGLIGVVLMGTATIYIKKHIHDK